MLTTGRLYHVTFLRNSTFFFSVYVVAKRTQEAQSLGFCESVYRPVGTTLSVYGIQLTFLSTYVTYS
jgi:hypothetical protein